MVSKTDLERERDPASQKLERDAQARLEYAQELALDDLHNLAADLHREFEGKRDRFQDN